MSPESVELICLSLPQTRLDYPFGPDVAVFKTADKVFALVHRHASWGWIVSLKCDPHEAVMLRDIFPAIKPGYHLNKRHWNSIQLDGSVPVNELTRQIELSWQLVQTQLPKAKRFQLATALPPETTE